MSSPFDTGCVELSKGGPVFGITFKLSPREEFCAHYGHFLWAWFTDKDELAVVFSHHRVVVRGRSLQQLVEKFAQQQVMVISVATRNMSLFAAEEGSSNPIVLSIRVEDRP